jgi:hypothetical protein
VTATTSELQVFLDGWLSQKAQRLPTMKVPATDANIGDLAGAIFARYGTDAEVTFYNLGCSVRLRVGEATAEIKSPT